MAYNPLPKITDLDLRKDFSEWCKSSGNITIEDIWYNCPRGDWMVMLWALSLDKQSWDDSSHHMLVLAVCECVKPAIDFVPKDEKPVRAIQMAELWAKGNNPDDKSAAIRAAQTCQKYVRDILENAYEPNSWDGCQTPEQSNSAASAVEAAQWAALTIQSVDYAVGAVSFACSAYSQQKEINKKREARLKALQKCADTLREMYPHPPIVEPNYA